MLAMKRSQEFTPASPSQAPPLQKKMRVSPPASYDAEMGEIGPDDVVNDSEENGWTKVEKRKAAKQRKQEVKLDVCVSLHCDANRSL